MLDLRKMVTLSGKQLSFSFCLLSKWGWPGGAMVLGNLSVPGRPTYLD